MVTIDDFRKFEIVTAKVLEVADHPDADKLFVLKVDTGEETLQLVAGIKRFYSPEELTGKTIIVIKNLEPAIIRGKKSEGMLLGASKGGEVVLLTTDRDIGAGAKVS